MKFERINKSNIIGLFVLVGAFLLSYYVVFCYGHQKMPPYGPFYFPNTMLEVTSKGEIVKEVKDYTYPLRCYINQDGLKLVVDRAMLAYYAYDENGQLIYTFQETYKHNVGLIYSPEKDKYMIINHVHKKKDAFEVLYTNEFSEPAAPALTFKNLKTLIPAKENFLGITKKDSKLKMFDKSQNTLWEMDNSLCNYPNFLSYGPNNTYVVACDNTLINFDAQGAVIDNYNFEYHPAIAIITPDKGIIASQHSKKRVLFYDSSFKLVKTIENFVLQDIMYSHDPDRIYLVGKALSND